MPNIEGQKRWSAVRLLETHELARGGVNGNLNEQAKALADRTEFLMDEKASKAEIVQGVFEFETYAEFDAYKANLPLNCTVVIGEENNSGTGTWGIGNNIWNGSLLSKSAHDPYQKSINFVNNNPFFRPQIVPSNTNVNSLGNGFWIIPSDSVAATLTGLPPQLTQPRRGFIFAMTSGTTSYQKFTRDFSSNCEAYERTGNGKGWGGTEHAWLDWIPADLYSLEILLKNWASSNPKFKSRWLVADENVNDLPEGVFFASSTVIPTLLNFPTDEMTDPDAGGIIFCDKAPNGAMPYQKVIRYTSVNGHIEEIDRIGNGGSLGGSFAWLPWKKKVSTKDIEDLKAKDIDLQNQVNSKPNINCFKNTALTADGAFLHEATLSLDEYGVSVASMDTSKISSIFYDYDIDNRIFVSGQSITFEVNMLTDAVGSSGGDISIIAYRADGTQTGSTITTRGTKLNEWERLKAKMVLPSDSKKFRLRLIRRTGNTFVKFKQPGLISSAWESTFINYFGSGSSDPKPSLKNLFVAKNGNDSNPGTKSLPKLTIQAAINYLVGLNIDGRITILDSGWYRESVSNNSDLTIELVSARNKRASIIGSDQLSVSKTLGYTKVYQANLAAKPVGMGGARGAPMIFEWGTPYSVILDEDVHSLQRGETYRLPYTPMLEASSKEELDTISGNGKWWWENGIIYFSATDGSDALLKQYEARVRPCLTHNNGSIVIRRIDSYFSNSYGMSFNGISTVRDDCGVFGAFHNGFSDNANSTMSNRDMALQNGNDGFNGTVSGYEGTHNMETANQADYFDPYSALNGDDGCSFHIRGTCNIWGGLFEYNTKAGVVHVTGGGGNCYGTISRGQTNGFYTATPAPDGRNKSSMACFNTIAEKNTYDYRSADADLLCVGTMSDNPTGYGYYQTGTGKIVCKDAKYRGDASKMKYGNVVVENFETVT
ncbi:hypothetical protein ABFO59_06205 [Acinetobacter radioresistens]|uniref:hypothetical protein n=1 Tax=Acinetobacter radioresistens TaxID=40216 RepID=UPI003213DEBC